MENRPPLPPKSLPAAAKATTLAIPSKTSPFKHRADCVAYGSERAGSSAAIDYHADWFTTASLTLVPFGRDLSDRPW